MTISNQSESVTDIDNNTRKNEEARVLAAKLHPYPGKQYALLKPLPRKPTLAGKASDAIAVATMGIHHCGISVKAELMWPATEFHDHDVEMAAFKTLGLVLTALLKVLPPQQIDQVLKDQVELLSFADGSELPDDKNIHQGE
jgi:hypothetical protein